MKDITIKEIAEICGVSRGTIDRVIHNRGNVSEETEKKIRASLEKFNYRPNKVGKMLAGKKKGMKVGVILISKGNPFFDDMISGLRKAFEDYSEYGVSGDIYELEGYNVQRQIDKLREIMDDYDVIIFNPMNDPRVVETINMLTDCGKVVININTNVENSRKLSYVGSDYFQGGQIAGGMLARITDGRTNIGVLTGSLNVLGHNERIKGLRESIARYEDMNIIKIAETKDSNSQGYRATLDMLESYEIDSIVIIAAGVEGVCQALIDQGLARKIKLVSFDDIAITRRMIREGVISATICQSPFEQGYKAIEIAYNHYVMGREAGDIDYIIKSEIKILENL